MKPRIVDGLCETNYSQETILEMDRKLNKWKQRCGDGRFIDGVLTECLGRTVLDTCMGVGDDVINLAKKGYNVFGNEIDLLFLAEAQRRIRESRESISVTSRDWRKLGRLFPVPCFSAVLCTGNSISYMFDRKSQRRAIDAFYNILESGGRLVIDERNFQYMLDNVEAISRGTFQFPGQWGEQSEGIHKAKPLEITEDYVHIEYTDPDDGAKLHLHFYPFKRNELLGLLREAGFRSIEQYSDYEPGYNSDADFYQYVGVK